MKFIRIFFILLASSSFCNAQNGLLPMDERGKFIYYELVEANGMAKEQLKERVSIFFKRPFEDLKLKTIQGDTLFIAIGKLIINKTLLVMSHPSGEILFHFQTELKNDKFRFWLTNFNFIAYQRDRYGNFVASTTKAVPLEDNPGKLNAGQWKEYQIQAAKYATQFAKSFKDHMTSKQLADQVVSEKVLVKKNW